MPYATTNCCLLCVYGAKGAGRGLKVPKGGTPLYMKKFIFRPFGKNLKMEVDQANICLIHFYKRNKQWATYQIRILKQGRGIWMIQFSNPGEVEGLLPKEQD